MRAICEIAGGTAQGGRRVGRPQALERAAADLEGLIASDPDPARWPRSSRASTRTSPTPGPRHPELVGNLDGAPIGLRYTANAEAIKREIARLRADGVPDSDAR